MEGLTDEKKEESQNLLKFWKKLIMNEEDQKLAQDFGLVPQSDQFSKDLNLDELSDEDYEWIMGHPNYWKKANPFKKENFDNIMKFLTDNDPDVMMARELSKLYQQ